MILSILDPQPAEPGDSPAMITLAVMSAHTKRPGELLHQASGFRVQQRYDVRIVLANGCDYGS